MMMSNDNHEGRPAVKLRLLFSEAVKLWLRYFPCLMHAECIRVLLVAASLVPLILCIYPGAELFALLALPIYLLTVPAFARNEAAMLVTAARENIWVSLRLASPEGYGRKVRQGLSQALRLLASLIPAAACFVYVRLLFSGTTDGLTVLRGMANLAGGDLVYGILTFVMLALATLLPFVLMCALRSHHAHTCALGVRRGFMRGRRLSLMRVWLAGAVTYLPFLCVAEGAIWMYVASLPASIAALVSGDAVLPSPTGTLIVLAVAFVVLLIPARALRRVLMTLFILKETDEMPLKEDANR